MRRGFFLTLDGPGGVGKSTTTQALTEMLTAAGWPVWRTTEPSRAPIGELARHGTHEYHGLTLACLVAADRYHHLATEVRPAIEAGYVVVCDRYVASSLVLQRRDGVPLGFVQAINAHADIPDLSVILTATPDTIRHRLAVRGSHGRFEDTDGTVEELELFAEAAAVLAMQGVDVLTLAVEGRKPDEIAAGIVEAVATRWVTVTGTGASTETRDVA